MTAFVPRRTAAGGMSNRLEREDYTSPCITSPAFSGLPSSIVVLFVVTSEKNTRLTP